MQFTNYNIYNIVTLYQNHFNDFTGYIPAKANFRLQKNLNLLFAAANEIDKVRVNILKEYGVEVKGKYTFTSNEQQEKAQRELNDLFNIEQEIEIIKLNIDDFDGVEFTPAQMQLLMFMFED